ncbi:protein phosphatase regulator [Sorochytrium milnesiophthora]
MSADDALDTASQAQQLSTSSSTRHRRNPGLTIDTSATTATATAAASAATNGDADATTPTSAATTLPASPLDDDIDFSLVYSLHTFVATMEGQVAVTRNEPLILLDDSNSYWWLVKPLKSNNIGYIPAEIVETPYERLARVNRQRNVQISQFRQDDIPGAPSKSTRTQTPELGARSVQFNADPRQDYFEYSPENSEVSSDDEDEDEYYQRRTASKQQQQQHHDYDDDDDEDVAHSGSDEDNNNNRVLANAAEEDDDDDDYIDEDEPWDPEATKLPQVTAVAAVATAVAVAEVDMESDDSLVVVAAPNKALASVEEQTSSSSPRGSSDSTDSIAQKIRAMAAKDAATSSPTRRSLTPYDPDHDQSDVAIRRTSLGAGLLLSNSQVNDDEPFQDAEEPLPAPASVDHRPPPRTSASTAVLRRTSSLIASREKGFDITELVRSNSDSSLPPFTSPPTTPTTATQSTDSDATPAAAPSPVLPREQKLDPITVLRIFPGKCAIPAQDATRFKTVVVTKTMTVHDLLRQAMLKYKVFGPLSPTAQQQAIGSSAQDDLYKDWYLTLKINGSQEVALEPAENVIALLARFQAQIQTAQAGGDSNTAFGSKTYSPSVPAGAKLSKHHIARPVMQVISPADSSAIQLLLNQHSALEHVMHRHNAKLIQVVMYGDKALGVAPSSDSGPVPPQVSTAAVLPNATMHIRMAKTIKIDPSDLAADVITKALSKFSMMEGKTLGGPDDFGLFVRMDAATAAPEDVASTPPAPLDSPLTTPPILASASQHGDEALPLDQPLPALSLTRKLPTYYLIRRRPTWSNTTMPLDSPVKIEQQQRKQQLAAAASSSSPSVQDAQPAAAPEKPAVASPTRNVVADLITSGKADSLRRSSSVSSSTSVPHRPSLTPATYSTSTPLSPDSTASLQQPSPALVLAESAAAVSSSSAVTPQTTAQHPPRALSVLDISALGIHSLDRKELPAHPGAAAPAAEEMVTERI